MAHRISAIPVTFIDLQNNIASFFKCKFSYRYAAVDKISTDIGRRAVPLQRLSFLFILAQHILVYTMFV